MGSTLAPRPFLLRRRARAMALEGLVSLLLLALAGCAPRLKLSSGLLKADPERTFLIYLRDNDLVRRQGEVEQRIPLARFGCIPEGSLSDSQIFELFPGGKRALVFSKLSRGGGGDLFGHRGRSVSASCIIDLERQEGTPLKGRLEEKSYLLSARRGDLRVRVGASTGRIYVWEAMPVREPLELIDLASGRQLRMPLPLEDENCDVVETRTELLIACIHAPGNAYLGEVVLARYGLETWPPEERTRTTMTVAPGRRLDRVSFLPDGRHLVTIVVESKDGRPDDLLDIRDVATGEPAVFFTNLDWVRAAIVEPTADGQGFLLGERVTPEGRGPDVGRVRHYRFDGTLLETWELDDSLNTVIATSDGKGFWVGFHDKARWYALKSRN
ncbi:hypothetical protein [Pyxidicoccus xibeiensis]|uniref:hypothetical protein n=1 Tax=Pyxidicoccus xibeiensis TaxID=2906759 RepID=UPI0020A73A55|nr:hypothetical protein [Pyxidicoccus xibeiensis]MCP3142415.1 hypothetical protein [Pyxidicoccus xibeiensis]